MFASLFIHSFYFERGQMTPQGAAGSQKQWCAILSCAVVRRVFLCVFLCVCVSVCVCVCVCVCKRESEREQGAKQRSSSSPLSSQLLRLKWSDSTSTQIWQTLTAVPHALLFIFNPFPFIALQYGWTDSAYCPQKRGVCVCVCVCVRFATTCTCSVCGCVCVSVRTRAR